MGLAFASDDAVRCAAELRAAGIAADGPKELKRLLELPDGTVTPQFALVQLAKEATPDLSAFVCCHRTPELVRRPGWLSHPNGARALLGVTVAAGEPRALVSAYRKLFGERSVRADAKAMVVETGAGRLLFATPDTLVARYRDIAALPDHALPWAVAMTLGVADLAACRRTLEAGGIAPKPLGAGLVLPPDAATGLFLEFVAL
jgi:hypothetical protein